jgi:hypothetical protein
MSFFGSLFGSDQRKAIKQSSATASKALQQGYDTGRTDITGYADKAQGYLDPYLQGGGQANALLASYLGVNGPEAQAKAMADFQQDPGYQAQFNAGGGALDKSATARGGLYSGAQMKGLQDYGQQFARTAFNDRINALSGFSGQGQQAAGAAAGLASQTGQSLGNMSFGFGQQKAANAINRGNALAQAANIGPQNMLNLAGTAMKAFGIPGMK